MVLYTGRQDNMERWPSGRRRTTGNRVTLNRVPGFKSLSLRHKKGIPPQSRWDTFFIVKVHHLNPRMSGALHRDMPVCAGCPNSLRCPLAQTWVRKSLSLRQKIPSQSRWNFFIQAAGLAYHHASACISSTKAENHSAFVVYHHAHACITHLSAA